MSKQIDDNGDLAASDADESAEANSMDYGSEADEMPSSEDILSELGLSPEDQDETLDDEASSATDELTDESAEDEEEESEDEDQDDDAEDEESEDEDSDEDEEDDESSTAAQARIDELTRKSKENEEKLAATEKQLQEAEQRIAAMQATPNPAGCFDSIDSMQDIAKTRDTLIQNKQYLLRNLDGFTTTVKGEDREYSAEEARELLADVEQKLDVDLPKRAQFLQQREPLVREARVAYPDMFKRGTAMSQYYENALKTVPGLSQLPNSHLVVGDGAIGYAVRSGKFKLVPVSEAKATEKKKEAPARKRSKAATAAPKRSAAPKQSSEEKRRTAAIQRAEAGDGDLDDITNLIETSVLG